jgi:S-DNA-T family DNA segregation ATPase FtsK/SpoIIIE
VVDPDLDKGPSDIARTVATVSQAARDAGVPEPRRPWLAELARAYDLARLPNPRTDERLLLGVVDDPQNQSQPTAFYEPDRDGNLAVFGTGGSGKSATLRTIAVSAAITARGGPVQVYAIDCGSGGLRMLEELPHVGAVVQGDDSERVTRVVRMLRDVVDERAARYAEVRASTIGEYRRLANAPAEPRIILLIDGIGAFREEYEYKSTPWFPVFAAFQQVATDGRPVGVHVVVSGDRPLSVPTSLGSTIQKRLVLRLAREEDYLAMDMPRDVLSVASPPGRAMLDGAELQVAVLGGDSNVSTQSRALARLRGVMVANGVQQAPPILSLPESIALGSLPANRGGGAVIGLDDLDLAPVVLPDRGPFMLSGPQGSGRTTALVTLAQAVRRANPAARVVYLAPRAGNVSGLPVWSTAAVGDDVAPLVDELVTLAESGTLARGQVVVVIEAVTEFTGSSVESALERLVRAMVRADQLVVGEAEASTWSQAWSLAQPFKGGREGLLLTPNEGDGDSLLSTGLGRVRRADFPPGRGFLVTGGVARKLQVALPEPV